MNTSRVPSDDDVANVLPERQAVGGEVALDESAVTLRLEILQDRLDRTAEPRIDPGGKLPEPCGQRLWTQHQQRDDALHPRRPGLVRGRDDDVVRAAPEAVPARAVEMVMAVDAGAFASFPHSGRL